MTNCHFQYISRSRLVDSVYLVGRGGLAGNINGRSVVRTRSGIVSWRVLFVCVPNHLKMLSNSFSEFHSRVSNFPFPPPFLSPWILILTFNSGFLSFPPPGTPVLTNFSFLGVELVCVNFIARYVYSILGLMDIIIVHLQFFFCLNSCFICKNKTGFVHCEAFSRFIIYIICCIKIY